LPIAANALRHSAAPGCGPRDEHALDKLEKNAYAPAPQP
jgi:hypothetical protein